MVPCILCRVILLGDSVSTDRWDGSIKMKLMNSQLVILVYHLTGSSQQLAIYQSPLPPPPYHSPGWMQLVILVYHLTGSSQQLATYQSSPPSYHPSLPLPRLDAAGDPCLPPDRQLPTAGHLPTRARPRVGLPVPYRLWALQLRLVRPGHGAR